MDVEAPPNAANAASSTGRGRMNRQPDSNTKNIRCKAMRFLFWYGFVYLIGTVILFVIFLIVIWGTMSVTHVDIGVWLVLWFLLTQAWGVALAWLTDMWTAQRQARAAQPVAPKPAADQARPTPGQLNKRFASWVEYSSESAHAVLFSSLGMWLSPHFPTILIFLSLFIMVGAIFSLLFYSPVYCAVQLILAFVVLGTGLLLFAGRRFAARVLLFVGVIALAAASTGEAVVLLARGGRGTMSRI